MRSLYSDITVKHGAAHRDGPDKASCLDEFRVCGLNENHLEDHNNKNNKNRAKILFLHLEEK